MVTIKSQSSLRSAITPSTCSAIITLVRLLPSVMGKLPYLLAMLYVQFLAVVTPVFWRRPA